MKYINIIIILFILSIDIAATTYFSMDLSSSSAGPLYGWGAIGIHTEAYTHTFYNNGGPGGRNSVCITPVEYSSTPPSPSTDSARLGWGLGSGTGMVPSQGGIRYIRYYTSFNHFDKDRLDVESQPYGGKAIIWNATIPGQRIIGGTSGPGPIQLDPSAIYADWVTKLGKNINNYPDAVSGTSSPQPPAPGIPQTPNAWHAMQLGIYTSSTSSATDGGFRVWVDNDNFASPNASSAFTTAMDVSVWSNDIQLWNSMPPPYIGHGYIVCFAAFEVADTFDSSWYTNMGGNPGIGNGFGGMSIIKRIKNDIKQSPIYRKRSSLFSLLSEYWFRFYGK